VVCDVHRRVAQFIATPLCWRSLLFSASSGLGTSDYHSLILLRFEATFGQSAYAHLFVTHALQEYLVKEWHLEGKSYVLHDRPPAHFRRTDPMSAHELFLRLTPSLQPPLPNLLLPKSDDGAYTALTHRGSNGMPELRPDRPALLVSSTSWTADEDFSLLITALDRYQAALTRGSPLPKLLVLITGKGALRSAFEKTVAARENSGAWKDVTARCTFVVAKDYPVLLGCADLGVSLHTSSSGRDLPMKMVDMFGCGVPVLAKGFPCIGELVKEGKNGMVFDNGAQLGEQLTVSTGWYHGLVRD
jgi:beta-1,4-mannosyltransferase